jgi:hypothetical protein
MNNLLRWAVMLVIAVAAGVWYGLNKSIPPVVFYAGLFIVIFAVSMFPVVYITYFSKNMNSVERFLLRSSKKPYYELMLDLVNGRLKEAERKLPKLATEQQRLAIQIPIHFEKQNIAALRRQIGEVKRPEARLYYSGLLALLEGDWDKVEECKQQMRSKVLRSVLDAEAAFKNGRLDDAMKYGDLAIAHSAGMQRFVLIKMRERQKRNEQRTSYF